MRKRLLSWLSTFLILTGTLLPAVSATAEQAEVISAGAWGLSSSGPVYANGNTTWEYSFSGTGSPQAMQRLDLSLCRSFGSENVNASHGGSVQSSIGPKVIQWQTRGMGDGDSVTVTYEGLWAAGSQSWTITTERDTNKGRVSGPACEALAPDFTVSKKVGTADDPSKAKANLALTGGGTVYYFYTVTNTGNSPITVESIADESVSGVTFPAAEIAPGQSVTAPSVSRSFPELTPDSPAQTETGTVTVTGSFAGKSVGPRAASATVINEAASVRPDFSITKTVSESSNSPGAGSLVLEGGGTVWYHYTVENTGDILLTIQSAVDDKLGSISFPNGSIAPGQSVTAISQPVTFEPLPPGSEPEVVQNTVAVTVSYRGGSLSHEDTATVTNNPLPASPGFAITNQVNNVNDRGTAVEHITLTGGGTAYFFYAIQNTGDVPLTIISAEDELPGSLVWDQTVLGPGDEARAATSESFTPLPPGSAPVNVENVLTVSVSYGGTPLGTQTDESSVTNQAPPVRETGSFTVQKRVSSDPGSPGASELVLDGGGTAYFTVTITNTGSLELFIELVDDDVLGPLTPDQIELAPGQSTEARAEKSFAPLAPGSQDETETNTVTVEVMYRNETAGTRTDQATVINRAPVVEKDFTVTKRVSATNDAATGTASLTLEGGGTAWYFYEVTNTGNVTLNIVEAVDDILGEVSFSESLLEPGESTMLATKSKSFAPLAPGSDSETETNTITVTVMFDDESTATREDQATVINTAISAIVDFTLTKRVSTVNDPNTGSASITLTGGGTAYYFYTVTNTGNVPLTITAATDDLLGALTFAPTVVPVGGTATATASKTFPSLAAGTPDQTETNTAAVSVSHGGRTPLSKSAQATVVNKARSGGGGGGCCVTPTPRTRFTLTKQASIQNDPTTGQNLLTLEGGGTVFYFYTVTNTGDTVITIETATDDKLGALTFSPTTLQPGEAATATAEKHFGALPPGGTAKSETNTASVSIRNENNLLFGPITAAATVINQPEPVRADFTVSKRVSTSNDPSAGRSSLTLPADGGTVYYFYTVTNTGNVELTIAEAVDDKLGPVSFSPAVLPVGGTATAMLSKSFGPGDAGLTESNVISVRTTHGGVVYGPKTDAVAVQVAEQEVGSLEIRVMDGSPRNTGIFPAIPNATVTLSNGMTGKTDSTGRLFFTGLPFGYYDATASATDPQNPTPDTLRSGHGSATLSKNTPDEVITIILAWDPPTAPPTPAPKPSITVIVCPTFTELGGEVIAAGPGGALVSGMLQSDGTYLIPELTAGAWSITLTGPGLAEPVTRTLGLRSDNAVPNNAYSLDLSAVCPAGTGSIGGRICSVKQPGAEIRGEGPGGVTAAVTVPSDGRLGQWREYLLANLVPGEWKLTLHTPGNQPVSQSVSVAAGGRARAADFTLACTGQPGAAHPSTWYYAGGLLIAAGLLLRRWAKA